MQKKQIVMYEHDAELQMAAIAAKGKTYTATAEETEEAMQKMLEIYKKYFKD